MQTRIALRGDRGTSGAWLDFSGTLCSLSLTGLDSPYSCQSWASCPLFPSPQAPSRATPAAAPRRACVSGVRPMGGGKEGRSRGISPPLSSSGSFSGRSCVSSRRGPSCRSSFQKPRTRCELRPVIPIYRSTNRGSQQLRSSARSAVWPLSGQCHGLCQSFLPYLSVSLLLRRESQKQTSSVRSRSSCSLFLCSSIQFLKTVFKHLKDRLS